MTVKKPQSCVRLDKLKSWSDLARAAAHNLRQTIPNRADPTKTPDNRILIGAQDDDLVAIAKSRINQDRKIRKDAVLALDGIILGSPEYFRPNNPHEYGKYDPARLEPWVEASMDWLQAEYGDRVISAALHIDEATPHIQFVMLPLDKKNHLSCDTVVGGKRQLSALQDRYHRAVKHLDIARGVKGSTAKHKTVQAMYGATMSPGPSLPTVKLSKPPGITSRTEDNIRAYASAAVKAQRKVALPIIAGLSNRADLAEKRAEELKLLLAKLREAEDLDQKTKAEMEAEIKRLRGELDHLAELGLGTMLTTMLRATALDQDRYQLPGGRIIAVDWRSWEADNGQRGKGAIDLYVAITGHNTDQTVRDLAHVFGGQVAVRTLRNHLINNVAKPHVAAIVKHLLPSPLATEVAERLRPEPDSRPEPEPKLRPMPRPSSGPNPKMTM